MLKNLKLFFVAAFMIFSVSGSCSAAETYLSNDNLTAYIEKCNEVLKTLNTGSKFDMPKAAKNEGELFIYTDKIETESKIPIEIIYTMKDGKLFKITLDAEVYNKEVGEYFDFLTKIYLRGLGLNESETSGMINKMHENRGKVNYFSKTLNIRFKLSLYGNNFLISADDK